VDKNNNNCREEEEDTNNNITTKISITTHLPKFGFQLLLLLLLSAADAKTTH
jgi:hypothetical protein